MHSCVPQNTGFHSERPQRRAFQFQIQFRFKFSAASFKPDKPQTNTQMNGVKKKKSSNVYYYFYEIKNICGHVSEAGTSQSAEKEAHSAQNHNNNNSKQ